MNPCAPASRALAVRLWAVGKLEDHDGPVAGVGAERAHSFTEGMELPIGIEKGDVDASSRPFPDVEFDDPNPGITGLEEGAEAFEDDHVIVDECDPDRFGHARTLRSNPDAEITRSGD